MANEYRYFNESNWTNRVNRSFVLVDLKRDNDLKR